ncbi:hypothetical protein D7Y15_22940 [Corallococcus sp. AB030]|uniref:TIR domain-containing protein n=1 Tax=Corallococcus TaxID=83461 RepID=UPI000EEF3706|nr:hypothetical protein D7Y15_22940 [Corallococcus sp. AB030]
MSPKRRVFVSFYGGDEAEVLQFVSRWADRSGVFTPRILHDAYNGVFVDSNDTEYVIGRIRREFIGDSTVTMLLLGKCTHGRRYVDWELKASLRQGATYSPNGLLAISLPSAPERLYLPERFKKNWASDNSKYARWYGPPSSAEQLSGWIEDAYVARTSRADLIENAQDRLLYNRRCRVHDETH